MPEQRAIAALILAAGQSSRMGQQKMLLPLGDRPILAHIVAAACASAAEPVVVVLGHEADAVRAALPTGRWEEVYNHAFAQGMATSLRAGVSLMAYRDSERQSSLGTLVLLGDQPLVTTAMLDRLITAAREHPDDPHAATYGGQRGTPVYFPRALFTEVYALEGDEGGRSILARHSARLRLIELGPPTAALDVDSPEDYERVRAYWADHGVTGAN
ncbi:MAG: nucleotidyltransferase family protein [Ktedonobacterales bacterium]|nr:nucleotidyltransferase family protein [Ktedonobacterales bacterium]